MKVGKFLQEWGVLLAFVLFMVFNLTQQGGVFLKPEALRNLFSQNVEVGLVAVGMTLVIIAGGIDLSVGSMLALASCFAMSHIVRSGDTGAAVAMALAIGSSVALGAVNGIIVTWGRVAPFIATLVGLLVFRSFAQILADNGTLAPSSTGALESLANDGVTIPFVTTTNGNPLVVQWSILIWIAVSLAAGFLLNRTPFGRHLVAVGSNDRAAHYSAINVNRVRFVTYTLLGFCVGLAACVNGSRMGSAASASTGQLLELDAIAAVVIGGTSLAGGKGRLWGTFVGVVFLGMISTTLVAASVTDSWRGVVKGAIILLAVLLQRGKKGL